MEHSLLASQEIPLFRGTHIHNGPPLDSNLNKINAVHTFKPSF